MEEETNIKVIEEVEEVGIKTKKEKDLDNWIPKTDLGRKIKDNEVIDIGYVLENGLRILEPEIVDALVPNLEQALIEVGQSKGKFGGGKRSIWRQTQKKTKEGNKPKFASVVVVGNKNEFVGIGKGKAKETVPAREKAIRAAKLNMIKIRTGCGSWECNCKEGHSIPFKVTGKSGSIIISLMPAPKGTGLKAEKECRKMLELAGIKDVYSKSFGHTKTKLNMIFACFNALRKLAEIKGR